MGDIPLVCAVILVYLSQMQGSSAVTPVFVQKGDDVMLNLTEADDLENSVAFWNFTDKSRNKESVLVKWVPGTKPEVSPGYTGRIEFTVKRCCVKLKNLQETDSGVYTALVMGAVGFNTITEYNITVQDPTAHKGNVAVPVSITFLFLIIIAAAVFGYLLWRRKKKTESIENAEYAVPEMEAIAQPLDPTSDSSSPPSTIYSLLEPHTGPTRSTEATEVVYSTV